MEWFGFFVLAYALIGAIPLGYLILRLLFSGEYRQKPVLQKLQMGTVVGIVTVILVQFVALMASLVVGNLDSSQKAFFFGLPLVFLIVVFATLYRERLSGLVIGKKPVERKPDSSEMTFADSTPSVSASESSAGPEFNFGFSANQKEQSKEAEEQDISSWRPSNWSQKKDSADSGQAKPVPASQPFSFESDQQNEPLSKEQVPKAAAEKKLDSAQTEQQPILPKPPTVSPVPETGFVLKPTPEIQGPATSGQDSGGSVAEGKVDSDGLTDDKIEKIKQALKKKLESNSE